MKILKPEDLEIAQMLKNHPIINEQDDYKIRYINVLEYFVEKYSSDDLWANQSLSLYKITLLKNVSAYRYDKFNLKHDSKSVIVTKLRSFKLFSYRYCLIIDIAFICAFNNKEKCESIFGELSSIYHKCYQKRIRQVFESLYDSSITIERIEQVQYLKRCWDLNRSFLKTAPIKVMVTANMSAGKSTLLNALIGEKINKTQNDACTAKIHYIVNKPYEDGFCYKFDGNLNLKADNLLLMEDSVNNSNSEIIVGASFKTINNIIKRIWLIDTPGVNSSQDRSHREVALNAICNIKPDLLIYLLNGENIGTDDDRRHLLYILEKYKGEILFVVNKLDKFRSKEDSISKTIDDAISDLTNMGFKEPKVVPISAYAAYLSKKAIFSNNLNEYEQDEFDVMSRKMNKDEYQLERFYPTDIQSSVQINNDDKNQCLLLHSGLLHLEKIIYNMR